MDVGHVLLGGPWQYYMKAIHDGFANRRGPILPDERRADGRRELRRPRILKQGRGEGYLYSKRRGKQAKNLFALAGEWHIK